MFSWLPSNLKRLIRSKKNIKRPPKSFTLHDSILRINNKVYACEVVDGISDKTLVKAKIELPPTMPERIELKLGTDATFRWMSVRWRDNNQISLQPITPWAIKKGWHGSA